MGHLIPARQLSRATAFCARYLWEKGQRKEAAEDLRASLIMQRRIGHEGQDLLLPVLVQMSTERVTKKVIALLLTDREAADILVGVLGDLTNGSSAPLIENGLLSDKRVIHLNWDRRKPMPEATEILRNIQQRGYAETAGREWKSNTDEAAALCGILPRRFFKAELPALEEKFKASKNPLSTMLFSNDMIRTARWLEEPLPCRVVAVPLMRPGGARDQKRCDGSARRVAVYCLPRKEAAPHRLESADRAHDEAHRGKV